MNNHYLCPCCSAIVPRESDKNTIVSSCDESGKTVKLRLVKSADELSRILRKRFLKNILELETFTKSDRMFLNMAWEQGAQVVFNRIFRKG